VLIGLMGAGKTSVGKRIAQRLGRPFVDVDRIIEERAGRSVSQIFKTDGEAGFRSLESAAVHDVLAAAVPSVIAFGGGAVLDPANRARAREAAVVVWLRAEPRDLAHRVAAAQRRTGGAARPLLNKGEQSTEAILTDLAVRREDAYRDAAHVTVDTGSRSAAQVATAVLAAAGWSP
jgi:shikimate kinase